MPVFVKAGSIIPVEPDLLYTTEKTADTLKVYVYTGHDGSFALYEDEGDNYNYEKGFSSTIGFQWDDARKILTIGDRKGEFPGMIAQRTFYIVLMDKTGATGFENARTAKRILYSGKKIAETFDRK